MQQAPFAWCRNARNEASLTRCLPQLHECVCSLNVCCSWASRKRCSLHLRVCVLQSGIKQKIPTTCVRVCVFMCLFVCERVREDVECVYACAWLHFGTTQKKMYPLHLYVHVHVHVCVCVCACADHFQRYKVRSCVCMCACTRVVV